MLHGKWLVCSLGLAFGLILAYNGKSLATLVHIEGAVYKLGSGENSLFWYLDMNDLADKTYYEQQDYIDNLNSTSYLGLSDWHVATPDEADALLTWGAPKFPTDNDIVIDALGLEAIGDSDLRYDYLTFLGDASVIEIFKPFPYIWQVEPTNIWGPKYFDSDASPNLGVLVVATPELATLTLLAMGGLVLRKRKKR